MNLKKCFISVAVACVVLALAWPGLVQGGQAGGRRRPRTDAERPSARTARPEAPVRGLQRLSEEERRRIRERWRNMSEQEREEFRAELRRRFGATGRPEAGRFFEQQIERMKKEHQQQVDQLKKILATAKKEKAVETAKQLEALIAKLQKAFDERLERLQQRRRALPERRGAGRQLEGPAGKKAPDFSLKSFDGKEYSLAALKGKIVVLEWMNFECPFSRYHYETKPTMTELAKKYKDKNVVWLAVNSTNHTTPEKNLAFAKKNKVPYPILDDRAGVVGKKYGAKTTPHMFVIAPNGNIVYDGAIDNAPMGKLKQDQQYVNYVAQALDALIANKPVPTSQTKSYGCSVKYAKQ